ncbi:MAG TPA: MSMEG_1061 family FMN-dependent PPOX-type flavoprotein, partial [Acidimicrobiales bacterium]
FTGPVVNDERALTSEADLRTVYRPAGQPALDKQIDHLDDHCVAFLAHAPLAMLATADANGRCDVSPKGGPPGFARALGPSLLAFGDLAGNNRLDSFTNLTDNPGVGLLFLIPGIDETLRVNGTGRVTTDADVLTACAIDGVSFRTALVVDVEEAYIHCAKAFRRAGAWTPEAWPDTSDLPTPACMLRDHIGLDLSAEEVGEVLEDGYRRTLWRSGG